ncbi:MAG: outer membrane protein assembly factor BamC [Succinatimonas sp.]|nr:outer membrane protein assembly factor BamC [Succinatimonas sp.]MCI7024811.1 outer membrane protein assembly factor BamC [Succinatimonas sp.]MDD6756400.1 outer membrane protein assembly factor BamC [Succinatimonas sp.]MDY6246374.1 outer membrane protein assembly factor BamC [Succinivibrio sp.]MDY6261476.1 outer membrane protein assembly factor BamC [Succinivibrio sp.]
MSRNKIKKLAALVAIGAIPALTLSGCVTIRNYWQEYFGMDKSSREPTGYYEHSDAEVTNNRIVVPQSLDNPGINPELQLPVVNKKLLTGPVGEAVDVRAPTAPYRSDVGCHTQWSSGEAIVWFENDGSHGIKTEDDAWMLLASVLKTMNVAVGKIAQGQYVLTTIARDFTEFGKPYDDTDADLGLKRYKQIYQIRVGRNAQGEIGIATKLVGSMTSLSSGTKMKDVLDMIEQERFAMGFSNQIIHEIDTKNQQSAYDPDNLIVSLGQDNNNHDAILVEAPFETTMELLNGMLPRCGWKITSHSVAKAEYEVEVLDSADDLIKLGANIRLDIKHGKYKIRLGIHGSSTAITFYDEKDAPLPSQAVSRLYPGFADVLVDEFKSYSGAASHEVKVN